MAAEGEERNLVVNAISSLLEGNGLGGPVPGDVNYGGVNYDLLGTLSAPEKRRLCALKKLQEASIVVETEFYKRIHEIEKEFEPKFAEFFEKRRTVTSGEYEPTDEEADYPIVQGITDEEKEMLDKKEQPSSGDSKGIRNFWLNVLKGTEAVTDLIQENDEPVLKHLTDITSSIELDPPGFTLYFHFSDNEFFANSILVKKYLLDMELDKADPYEFDGPTVGKAIGDTINWKEGKNITQKVIKKKQKKDGSSNKFVTKVVRADSFFNFFTPPDIPEKDEMNEDQEEEYVEAHDSLRADYEIGQILRDQVVPRAVLFFTGEVTNEDSFDDGFEGSSADGDDGESSSDGDE